MYYNQRMNNELYHYGVLGMKWGVRKSGSRLKKEKRVFDRSSDLARNLKVKNKTKRNSRMNLSKMSDQELRNKLNRELLERQYNDVFNPPVQSKGRKYINSVLDTSVKGLSIAGSAAGLAIAIKELKGGKQNVL